MSGPIRLLVCDIDGTLVRPDKSLGAPVIDAVRRLREAGCAVAAISARPVSGVLPIVRRLELPGRLGAFNGGTIAEPDGRVVSAERLAPEVAAEAVERFAQPWLTTWLFADGRWHATGTDNPHTDSERITAAQEPVIVRGFDDLLQRVDKIVAVSDDGARLGALEAETAEALGDRAAVARSQTYYLDVTAPGANKGAGVRRLAEAHGVPLAETAVIGDGENDTRMFAVAGLSIAVGNASNRVQAAADEVVASNAEDGVAQAIDGLIFPQVRA